MAFAPGIIDRMYAPSPVRVRPSCQLNPVSLIGVPVSSKMVLPLIRSRAGFSGGGDGTGAGGGAAPDVQAASETVCVGSEERRRHSEEANVHARQRVSRPQLLQQRPASDAFNSL